MKHSVLIALVFLAGFGASALAADEHLTDQQRLGWRLFETSCGVCHTRPTLVAGMLGSARGRIVHLFLPAKRSHSDRIGGISPLATRLDFPLLQGKNRIWRPEGRPKIGKSRSRSPACVRFDRSADSGIYGPRQRNWQGIGSGIW